MNKNGLTCSLMVIFFIIFNVYILNGANNFYLDLFLVCKPHGANKYQLKHLYYFNKSLIRPSKEPYLNFIYFKPFYLILKEIVSIF